MTQLSVIKLTVILNFIKPLSGVVFDPHKDYDYRRNFFISYCAKYLKVFNSMFQLRTKKGKERVKVVIAGFKSINDQLRKESNYENNNLLTQFMKQKKKKN